ncbi:MAG: hypothetical protein P8M25_03130, partial [Paracoccaceae bacterium]|nr:hypothetical protein [Paracoccaceae bacterium]
RPNYFYCNLCRGRLWIETIDNGLQSQQVTAAIGIPHSVAHAKRKCIFGFWSSVMIILSVSHPPLGSSNLVDSDAGDASGTRTVIFSVISLNRSLTGHIAELRNSH